MLSPKQKALAKHLIDVECCNWREVIEYVQGIDEDTIEREECPLVNECGVREFTVYTDEEADEAWEEYLMSYIDECVLHEMPEHLREWFDTDGFIEHLKTDGRGHSLNGWDGTEDEYKINGEWFYIYKN